MKKTIFILFGIFLVAEFMVMMFLDYFALAQLNIWLNSIVDASAMALVAILGIEWVTKREYTATKNLYVDETMPIKASFIVFAIQLSLMFLLPTIPFELNAWEEAIFDAVIFSTCSVAAIHAVILSRMDVVHTEEDKLDHVMRATKYFFAAGFLLLIVLMSAFLYGVYHQQLRLNINSVIARSDEILHSINRLLYYQLDTAARDLLSASLEPDALEILNGDYSNIEKLKERYKYSLSIKKSYDQIRLIDINGHELIRVHIHEGSIHEVPEQLLQDKAQRYYVKEGKKLSKGQIYVSPMDLNVEEGKIETPYKPTIRIVTPVVDTDGTTRGLIVINMLGNTFLDIIHKEAHKTKASLMLLNNKGYWLYGNTPEINWAFMFPEKTSDKYRFQGEFPEVWNAITQAGKNIIHQDEHVFIAKFINDSISDTGNQWGITAAPDNRHYKNLPRWIMILDVNTSDKSIQPVYLRNYLYMVFIVSFILIAIVVFYLARMQIINIENSNAT